MNPWLLPRAMIAPAVIGWRILGHALGAKWRLRLVVLGGVASTVFVLVAENQGWAAESRPVPLVICDVFKRNCAGALRVSWCESRWDTRARNGQYLGTFQMGSWERRRYGHGSSAYAQARAAHRYFRASGSDWSPWECKP